MLEKTMAMLAGIKPGQYVDDDVACYDDHELKELGLVLNRLVYAPSKLRKVLQEMGATLTRADFYSEIPSIAEVEQAFRENANLRLDAVFQEKEFLQAYLAELTEYSAEFDPPLSPGSKHEFSWINDQFSYSDAATYYSMVRKIKPKTLVEIGCGHSSLVAQKALKRNGGGRHIAVEPYPQDFLKTLPGIELHGTRAQGLTLEFLNDVLSDGDILFIDTTHAVKHNSDCLHIYLRLLPFIARDITVHVHDIYLPGTLPLEMMRDSQIFWNEQYLLYAYMMRNPTVRMLYGSRYHSQHNGTLLKKLMHGRFQEGGASVWFSQSAPTRRLATAPSEAASAEQSWQNALPAVAVDTPLREHARFTAPGSAYEEFDPRILEGCPTLSGVKPPLVAAFYLPQFHPILENDAFWGRGFTEWRQLPRGVPRFQDHYQPRIPRDLGFYNLTDENTIRRQAEMARSAGIGAFAHYYYRFGHKRVLNDPLEILLESDIEMPFFLIWANESWTRTWDGSENDILLKQDYRAEDEAALLADLARNMRDWRYVRLDGRPLLVIYNPGHIPNCAEAVARWREAWRTRHRLDPLIFMAQTFGHEDPREFGFDGALEFPPHNLSTHYDRDIEPFSADFKGRIINYDDLAAASLAKPMADFPLVKTLVPSWDNEPRRPNRGLVVRGSTPAAYQAWLEALVERAMERPVHGTPLVAVNAWNEWAEGAYLEPDIHFGGAYLNATARGINAAVSTRYAQESATLRAAGPGPSRPTIFLQIGLHKTGTTSIQVALCRLRGQLAGEGALYPRTACPDLADQGQHLLPWSLVEEDRIPSVRGAKARFGEGERDALWDKLHEEISQSKAGTVIISSEEFDTLGPAAIEALGRKLDRYDVIPVLCARRTSAQLESNYRTAVAYMGYSSEIGDFFREHRSRDDLHNMVRDWRSIALDGAMKIIAYDDPEIGRDIVQTFLHAVGLERLADWMGPQARLNTTPPAFICELLRELRTQGAAEADVQRALEQFSNLGIRMGARGAYTCMPVDLEAALDEDYRLQIEQLAMDPETNTMWIGKPPASFVPSVAQPVTAFGPAILALGDELSRRTAARWKS